MKCRVLTLELATFRINALVHLFQLGLQVFEFLAACFGGSFQASLRKCLLDPVQLIFLLVEYPFAAGKSVFSPGHELLLRYCDVCAAEFAPIVDYMLALELYELHKSGMRTVYGSWKWAHTFASYQPRITLLTCGSHRNRHGNIAV